jgi:hypothetical protein
MGRKRHDQLRPPVTTLQDPATKAVYLSVESLAALSNRFEKIEPPKPPTIDSQALAWSKSADGLTAQYAGKTFVQHKAISPEHGVWGTVFKSWLVRAAFPNGEVLNVIQDLETRKLWVDPSIADRLKARFIDDANQPLGSCTVGNLPVSTNLGALGDSGNVLYELRGVHVAFTREFHPASSTRKFTHNVERVAKLFERWLEKGEAPKHIPVHRVRDSFTPRTYITERDLHALSSAYSRLKSQPLPQL